MSIRKAVIPAAGFGTRFLPQTKAMPKEMLPLVDKPVIQYVVEELVEAGITEIIIVTGYHKRSIEDHFDHNFELEAHLKDSGKLNRLAMIEGIPELANFYYLRQKGPKGNATPVWNAKEIIGDEPFLVFWGDDFIDAKPSRARQLIETYEKYQASVLGCVQTSRPEDTRRYGYAAGTEVENGVIEVAELIEKPGPDKAPSDLAVVSGFVFTPDIFPAIEEANKRRPEGEELVYIDALNVLRENGHKVYARAIKNGTYYDCGNILEYMKTITSFALRHPEINGEYKRYLEEMLKISEN
ncbi:MAG: UTP--glucose-1-phosphate uridylyltransferase [bacterium]|nr:UTP--glucose-1-phosphate uridylyltransferase [bacterium]